MAFAEWWLKKWSPAGNDPNFIKVQIDPVEVWGCRGAFGPMLVLPYKLPKAAETVPFHKGEMRGFAKRVLASMTAETGLQLSPERAQAFAEGMQEACAKGSSGS